jgi:hypothetical protein
MDMTNNEIGRLLDTILSLTGFNRIPGFSHPSSREIVRAESELEFKIPLSYRHALEHLQDIEVPRWELLRVIGEKDSAASQVDIVSRNLWLRKDRRFPAFLISFFTDGLADETCFDLRTPQDREYEIVIWRHDVPDKKEPVVTKAKTFLEWLRKESQDAPDIYG